MKLREFINTYFNNWIPKWLKQALWTEPQLTPDSGELFLTALRPTSHNYNNSTISKFSFIAFLAILKILIETKIERNVSIDQYTTTVVSWVVRCVRDYRLTGLTSMTRWWWWCGSVAGVGRRSGTQIVRAWPTLITLIWGRTCGLRQGDH